MAGSPSERRLYRSFGSFARVVGLSIAEPNPFAVTCRGGLAVAALRVWSGSCYSVEVAEGGVLQP
ncbi:hypothetical protein ADL26_15520, partial [Thermoactinomyces vulgaris]